MAPGTLTHLTLLTDMLPAFFDSFLAAPVCARLTHLALPHFVGVPPVAQDAPHLAGATKGVGGVCRDDDDDDDDDVSDSDPGNVNGRSGNISDSDGQRREWQQRGSGLRKGSVRVRTRFNVVLPSLNPELDLWSGSAQMLNLELNFGLVQKSSGPNFGSELDCSIPSP
ncbi:hypothetical protein EDB84DRAFT_1442858 [Lactarius hengduanensis]|nr:hypothetical protein EDB84DRAFT_1442858 [Lactarius hengduanensis]